MKAITILAYLLIGTTGSLGQNTDPASAEVILLNTVREIANALISSNNTPKHTPSPVQNLASGNASEEDILMSNLEKMDQIHKDLHKIPEITAIQKKLFRQYPMLAATTLDFISESDAPYEKQQAKKNDYFQLAPAGNLQSSRLDPAHDLTSFKLDPAPDLSSIKQPRK